MGFLLSLALCWPALPGAVRGRRRPGSSPGRDGFWIFVVLDPPSAQGKETSWIHLLQNLHEIQRIRGFTWHQASDPHGAAICPRASTCPTDHLHAAACSKTLLRGREVAPVNSRVPIRTISCSRVPFNFASQMGGRTRTFLPGRLGPFFFFPASVPGGLACLPPLPTQAFLWS